MDHYDLDWQTFAKLRGKGVRPKYGLRPITGAMLLLTGYILWLMPRLWNSLI